MRKDFFGIEGLNIAWYRFIIAVGFLSSPAPAAYRIKYYGIKSERAAHFCKCKGVQLFRFLDMTAPDLILDQAIAGGESYRRVEELVSGTESVTVFR